MITLERLILHEIDWRTNEISIIKTTPFLYSFSPERREILKKYTIPTFYSLWEGFVSNSFKIYVEHLNDLNLSADQIHISILTHCLDSKYHLREAKTDFEKQKILVKNMCEYLEREIILPTGIPTESNINYKVINSILKRFNLEILDRTEYEKRLDRLLFFRNKLAHGENAIPIEQKDINEMSQTVILSMHAVAEKIIDGYMKKAYLNN